MNLLFQDKNMFGTLHDTKFVPYSIGHSAIVTEISAVPYIISLNTRVAK